MGVDHQQERRSDCRRYNKRHSITLGGSYGETATVGPPRQPYRMGCVRVVEPIVALFAFAVFLSSPLNQQYIYRRFGNFSTNDSTGSTCSPNGSDVEDELEKEAQAAASRFQVRLDLVGFLPAVLASLVLGVYSDTSGRRLMMILPCIGYSLESIVYILIVSLELPLPWLYLGCLLRGATGGYASILAGSFAYLTDVANPANLNMRVACLDMLIGISGGIGAVISGHMLQAMGYAFVYLCVCLILVLCIIYVACVLEETITKDIHVESLIPAEDGQDDSIATCDSAAEIRMRIPAEARKKRNVLTKLLKQNYKSFSNLFCEVDSGVRSSGGPGSKRWRLALLLVAFTFYLLAEIGGSLPVSLFEMKAPLCWDALLLGYGSAVGFAIFITSFVGVTVLSRCLSDPPIALIGISTFTVGMAMICGVQTTLMMFLVRLPLMFTIMPVAVMRSMMSKTVLPSEQGTLFSLVGSLELLAGIVGSVVFNNVYAVTVGWFACLVFLLSSAVAVIPFLILSVLWCDEIMCRRRRGISALQDESAQTH
uniref:Lysosomal proton-coupled steroid conjugate and bile acid symporter SLC46A3 n=2 Tax=Petromyzon marinus TaxID=7757 RepID=A0AAJ7T4P8_PETMA|nr:solute carrier family 46 member 3-like isoform X1 [Petromyzon marinus]